MRFRLLILFAIILLAAPPAHAEVVLILRREAQPAGNYVRVCDIARVEGPKELVREVSAVVLGPTPARGQTRAFSRWDVEARLYEMGVAAPFSFSGNDSVTVLGNGVPARQPVPEPAHFGQLAPIPVQSLARSPLGGADGDPPRRTVGTAPSPPPAAVMPGPRVFEPKERGAPAKTPLSDEARKRIAQAASVYLANRYKEAGSRRPDLEVEATILGASGAVPHSAHEVRVENGDGRVPGKVSLTLLVRDTEESAPREVAVEADTKLFARALVAARNLSRGESLEQRDVAVARVRMDAGKSYLPPAPAFAEGRETRRALRAGEVILAEDAEPGMVVKRGDTVEIVTTGRGWSISGTGKAQGAGMIDDMIMVEDSSTKKKYSARIVGRNRVEAVIKKNGIQ